MTALPRQQWTADIALRMRRYFPLKCGGTTAFVWLFFIAYFQILRHPVYPVTLMPLTALDRLIPYQPWTLVAYVSLWVYVGVAPGLQLTLRELFVYALWMALLCTAGLLCFYFWPTRVPVVGADDSAFPGFDLLRRVDAAGNACPSMHVAAAIFTAIRIDDIVRWVRCPLSLRAANAAWVALITYSTLATRQHVVLDVAAGALLGTLFVIPSLVWRPRRERLQVSGR